MQEMCGYNRRRKGFLLMKVVCLKITGSVRILKVTLKHSDRINKKMSCLSRSNKFLINKKKDAMTLTTHN